MESKRLSFAKLTAIGYGVRVSVPGSTHFRNRRSKPTVGRGKPSSINRS